MARVVEDFKTEDGLWGRTYSVNGESFQSKAYSTWYSMMHRCRAGSSTQVRNPSYEGCTVSARFSDFQIFAEWYTSQKGYGEDGYELDKDLLISGNKEYSEHACALIPQALNTFLVKESNHRRDLPVGVYYRKDTGKYRAQIRFDNKSLVVGAYDTPCAARDAYITAKEKFARVWYERLKGGEFAIEDKVIERMRVWRYH